MTGLIMDKLTEVNEIYASLIVRQIDANVDSALFQMFLWRYETKD